MIREFQVGSRTVGLGHPCLLIAEVAQAHDGSLGTAHAFIDAIADAGADAVKFQTHIAAAESTPQEPWRVKFSPQDASRYDYWKRMEFTEQQWQGLKEHADRRGLIFLSSPFSFEAFELLQRLGVAAWKAASGELANLPLLEMMAATRLPVLVSSGMSDLAELDRAVALLRALQAPCAVLQCTTKYPCPPEELGLNLIADFARRYGCPAGLSDHSGTIYAGLAACALGANIIETHVTFSRQMFGPDVPASITFPELTQMVQGVRFTEAALAHPLDKDAAAADGAGMRRLFTKSVVLSSALLAGTVLTREVLRFKKPGTGIPAQDWGRVVGRRLRHDRPEDWILVEDDLAPADLGGKS